MSSSPDIQEAVIDQLNMESLQILNEITKEHPGANGGYYAWFQKLITRAEAEGNNARSMAGVIVMKAYGDELTSKDQTFYPDRLESRISTSIRDMVQGR